MQGSNLLISFIVATAGWMLVAQAFGPPLAQLLYSRKVSALQLSGLTFATEDEAKSWALDAGKTSYQTAYLLLAVACGSIAGLLNFPLVGFSRSMNGWSWARIIVLCASSWLVAALVHGNSL